MTGIISYTFGLKSSFVDLLLLLLLWLLVRLGRLERLFMFKGVWVGASHNC